MSEISINDLFDAFKRGGGGDFTLFDPGVYNLEITSVKVKQSNDGLTTILRCVDGPNAGQTTALFHSVKGEAGGIFKQNMVAYGLPEEWIASLQSLSSTKAVLDTIATALKGRTVQAQLEQRPYNGEMRQQVKIGGITCIQAPPLPPVGGVPSIAVAPQVPTQAPAPVEQAPPQLAVVPPPAAAPPPVAAVAAPPPAAAPPPPAAAPPPVAAVAAVPPPAVAVVVEDPGF